MILLLNKSVLTCLGTIIIEDARILFLRKLLLELSLPCFSINSVAVPSSMMLPASSSIHNRSI